MQIKSEFINADGSVAHVIYEDADSFGSLDSTKVKQTYAVCLLDGKMVIVLHGRKNTWGLVGGSVEPGESYEDCLKREIKEESNMKVLDFKPVGYQTVKTGDKEIYQLRYVCKVEPYGEFLSDPDGNITEIKVVDPKDYKKYFDWGAVGDRIVERAIELKEKL
jgi:ADP-ribose pyrophosphatase YjhB (NUDIX family)